MHKKAEKKSSRVIETLGLTTVALSTGTQPRAFQNQAKSVEVFVGHKNNVLDTFIPALSEYCLGRPRLLRL